MSHRYTGHTQERMIMGIQSALFLDQKVTMNGESMVMTEVVIWFSRIQKEEPDTPTNLSNGLGILIKAMFKPIIWAMNVQLLTSSTRGFIKSMESLLMVGMASLTPLGNNKKTTTTLKDNKALSL